MDEERLAGIKLAACPMCGSSKICIDETKEGERVQFQARCDDCLVSGPRKDTLKEAAAAWSLRAPSQRLINAELFAEAGEACFDALKSALNDQRLVAEVELTSNLAASFHETRYQGAGERLQYSGMALRAFRRLMDDRNEGKSLKSVQLEREAALESELHETSLLLADAYGAYVEGSDLFRLRVEETVCSAILDPDSIKEGAGHLIRAAEEVWAGQTVLDEALPMWSQLDLPSKKKVVLKAMTSTQFNRFTWAPDWRPMPAPNDAEILLLRTDGSLTVICAEENDMDWKEDYDDVQGTVPMFWLPVEDLYTTLEFEPAPELELA